jgi:hypothetical protein
MTVNWSNSYLPILDQSEKFHFAETFEIKPEAYTVSVGMYFIRRNTKMSTSRDKIKSTWR